jgi:succinoglycan biosynthesis protein ExoA
MIDSSQFPFVSVIMPIRNEADFVTRSLGAVLGQDYPHERMEVLIADGMSDDGTRELVQRLAATSDIPLTVVDNTRQIVPTGFNAAYRQSRGDIIVRVDGHTIIEKDYVTQCVKTLERTEASNVGGRMTAVSTTAFGKAVSVATSTPFGVGGARFHYSNAEEWVDTVYMGAWRRSVFENLGLFDEELVRNQDDEFNYRLLDHGGRILLNPNIRSHYYNRSSFSKLWMQYYQYGLYKVRVMQKHPRQMRPRQFAPLLLVSALLGGMVLAPFSRRLRFLLLLLTLAYVVTNGTASLLTARRFGSAHLFRLPLIFAVLHLSYGLGFLRGLVKFRRQWYEK